MILSCEVIKKRSCEKTTKKQKINMDTIKQNPIKFGIAFLVILTINIAGWYLFITWNKPLAEPLNLPTLTTIPEDTEEPTETTVPTVEGTEVPEPSPTFTYTPAPTATSKPICGGPEYMNVLVTGVATKGYLYGLADAIRVVRVDFRNQKITVLSFPRDLWVDIPVSVPGKTNGITPGKLNQAYFYGTEGMGYYSGPGYGSGLLAETLQNEYGLHIDHYLSANLYGFREIIDVLDGVNVCLATPVYKKKTDFITGAEFPVRYLDAGCQHITGEQAEFVVRQRIKIGDSGRVNQQTVVLKALAAKMLSPTGLKSLPDIVERLKTYVVFDFSPAQINQMLCLANRIDHKADIVYISIPDDMLEASWEKDEVRGGQYTSALVVDKTDMRELMADFQQGIWP